MFLFNRCAAEQFGDKTPQEIIHILTETLEGHQREIMAHMTVEEIYRYLLNEKIIVKNDYFTYFHKYLAIANYSFR